MTEPDLVTRLVDADILEYTDDGQSFKRTETFDESTHEYDEEETPELPANLLALAEEHGLVGELVAVAQACDDISTENLTRTLLILLEFDRPEPPDDGAPDSFTPVHGDLLGLYTQLFERAIVYVWRHDCEPCDVVREEFESLFPKPPEDIALFAVYGPDSAAILEEEWEVVVGPTTLFVENGAVGSRLLGSPYPSVIEHEIDTLRN